MAPSKTFFACIVAAFLFVSMIQAHEVVMDINGIGSSQLDTKIDCGTECARRCAVSSRPNLCNRACETCCDRCNCVPPGTFGNYDKCPCYANETTHDGRKKCP